MAHVKEFQVLQKDKGVSGLMYLLDTQLLMRSLQKSLPDITIKSLDKRYIRYKPNTSLLVRYQMVTSEDRSYDLYAKCYNLSQSKLSNNKKKRIEAVIGQVGYLSFPQKAIEIFLFPNDARLRAIRRLQNSHQRYSLLKKVLAGAEKKVVKDLPFSTLTTLQYKPERRYVACLTSPRGDKAVLKAYREEPYKQTLAHIEQLEKLGVKLFSPLLGQYDKYNILIFQWSEGEPLSEVWQSPDFNVDLLRKLAQQLAKFHQGSWQQVVVPRKNNLVAILEGLSHIVPHLQQSAQQIAARLHEQLQLIPDINVRCHGDFYARQILCHHKDLYWLDLDDICLAHPGRDIGTFVAHLEWDVLRGRLTQQQASRYEHIFVSAYQRYAKQVFQQHHLNSLIALHLFKLIHHPFRNCEQGWSEQTEQLLARIQQRLKKGAESHRKNTVEVYPFLGRKPRICNPFSLKKDVTLNVLLQRAIDPACCLIWFRSYLPDEEVKAVESICVLRYKPGKRLLLAYRLRTSSGILTLYGKIRAKGLHRSVFRINQQIYQKGNTLFADSGWRVPKPICMVPECQMWLQKHVRGTEFTQLVTEGRAEAVAHKVAIMSHSLHYSGILIAKSHGVMQELDVLKKQLYDVAEKNRQWKADIHKLYEALHYHATPLLTRPYHCIHRDFYPDQVMVNHEQLYLLDLDLFCMGDPCLDIGNFIAHVQEQALREKGDLEAYQSVTDIISEYYLHLTGHREADAEAIEIYRLLSLARHIAISQRIPDRMHLTPVLLDLSLQQVTFNEH